MAAITADTSGGGVAAVTRMIWRVLKEEWPAAWLITLDDRARGTDEGRTAHTLARLNFGARLARPQLFGDCDWIMYTHLSAALVQSYLPKPARRPYAIFLHGIEAWRPLDRRRRQVLENATLLLANSNYTARRVAEAHPWIGPISTCRLSLPEEWATRRSTQLTGTLPNAQEVVIVGRLSSEERYKGHDELLEAWPGVVARIPEARLVIIGTGDDEMRLRQKAEELGVGTSVLFTGFVSPGELESWYARAAVFAMPSRNEGFGLVYLEAMAHGVACVGSTHDAAGEVIEDGVTGFLVDQSGSDTLRDRLVALLADDELRIRMGKEGERRLRQHFSYASFRDRLVSLCNDAFGVETGRAMNTGSARKAAASR